MASLPISFAPPTVRVYAAKGSAGGGSVKEEKSLLDWILGNLTKQDQFYETDPILQRAEDKTSSGTGTGTGTGSASGRKSTVAVPQKKKNGGSGGVFGGLFAKK